MQQDIEMFGSGAVRCQRYRTGQHTGNQYQAFEKMDVAHGDGILSGSGYGDMVVLSVPCRGEGVKRPQYFACGVAAKPPFAHAFQEMSERALAARVFALD
jgi:hypothetical protein